MRTPGRCTNLEGCWIGSTQRDVWLSIGEDFTCPNCGSALTAPPRRSISAKSLKKVATTGVALTMSLAAMALGVVKLSTIKWDAPRQMVSSRAMSGVQSGGHQIYAGSVALPVPHTRTEVTAQAGAPAQPGASVTPSVQAHASATPKLATPLRPAPPSVLVFNAEPSRAAHAPDSVPAAPDSGSEAGMAVPAASMVTMISEAALVVPPSENRPLVLPISFGKPEAPEDDMAPAAPRWRFHGFVRTRHSYFLPGPGAVSPSDSVAEICRRAGFLR